MTLATPPPATEPVPLRTTQVCAGAVGWVVTVTV
jgi:hypothetical protein